MNPTNEPAAARWELSSVVEYARARRVRKSSTWGLAAFLAALFVLVLGQAAFRGMLNLATAVGAMGVVLALVGGALGQVISRLSSAEVSRFGAITVEPAAIIVERAEGGPQRFPRRHIVNGWLEPSGAVHIVFRDATELVLFPAADDARAGGEVLLDALGLSARQRVARFSLGGLADRSWPARILLGAASVASFAATLLALAMTFAALAQPHLERSYPLSWLVAVAAVAVRTAGARALGKRTILIGTDGVRIRGWRERFIPLEQIARVDEDDDGATIHLADGPAVRLAHDRDRDELDRGSFVARLEQVRLGRSRGAPGEALGAELDQGGRSVDQWLAHLRSLVGSEGAYRRARVDAETLERVVDDGAAPARRRIGAALALSALGDEPAKQRIRLAAEASTDDALREALELAAEGEVDEAALAKLATR